MPKVMTLSGATPASGLGQPTGGTCKCVRNPRTGKSVKLCFVGKSKKTRSGWLFKGSCR